MDRNCAQKVGLQIPTSAQELKSMLCNKANLQKLEQAVQCQIDQYKAKNLDAIAEHDKLKKVRDY